MRLGPEELESAVLGGGVLGGGGGGAIDEGLRLGREALEAGTPKLVEVEDLPAEGWVATVSLVGAPAAKESRVESRDLVRAWELLGPLVEAPLRGIIGSENGGAATVNGWLQSAVTGLPLVDAPADGRAHPTGDMGALGLDRIEGYVSRQAAVGGSRERGLYLEQQVSARLRLANRLVRSAADAAGGLVAVARNPIDVAYLETHAAVGAIQQALALGRIVKAQGPSGARAVASALGDALAGSVVAEGKVSALTLETRGGFDVGAATVEDVEISIWNEYLTLERGAERLATFPDLIVTLDGATGLPVTSAELAVGREVIVIAAPSSSLHLGAGSRVRDNYSALEAAVGKALVPYSFPEV